MNILERFNAMDYGPAPEARNEADAWLAARDFSKALYIGGEWKAAASGRTFDVSEPSTTKLLAKVSDAGAADIDAAVSAAAKALPKWSGQSGYQRSKVLYAIGRAMQRHQRLFAVLESIDNGKPIRESRDIDVPLAIRHFIHHAGWAQALDREFPDHRPAGVVGQVIPWNFPLLMLAWKIAPALAAGCTVVLKPAEFTPLTAILFAQICESVGMPKGVVNIVPGGPEAGAALVAHPDVQKIAFTGSSEVGKIIRKATAGSGKKLSLELGGKSAFIVFEDADLDSAVEGLVDGIWFNQGQVCCAGSRLLVQEGVADAFIAKVKARMAKLRLGSPLDKNTDIGPLVDRVQLERVRGLIEQGAAQGAECWQPDCPLPETGWFHLPTLATGVSPANILAQEEVFGPVLATMTFRTNEEAVELANNTRYGLAASVWSENLNVALHVAPQLKAGVVWVNGTNMFDAACGFGGYRESGFGREGGREGMFEYLVAPFPYGAAIKPAADAAAGAGGRRLVARHRPHRKTVHRRQADPAGRKLFAAGAGPQGQGSGRGRPRQPQGYSRCRDGRPRGKGLGGGDGLQPQSGSLLSGGKPLGPRGRVFGAAGFADRRFRQGGGRGGGAFGRAPVLLRRHGRQVRGARSPAPGARGDAGAARAGRRDRRGRAGRRAAARLHLDGRRRRWRWAMRWSRCPARNIRCSPPISIR